MAIFVFYVSGTHIRQKCVAWYIVHQNPLYQLKVVVTLSGIVDVGRQILSILHAKDTYSWWVITQLVSRHPVLCAHCCDIMTVHILMLLCHPVHFLGIVQVVKNELPSSIGLNSLGVLRLYMLRSILAPTSHELPLMDDGITNGFVMILAKLIKFLVQVGVTSDQT